MTGWTNSSGKQTQHTIWTKPSSLSKCSPKISQSYKEGGLIGAVLLKLIQPKDALGQVTSALWPWAQQPVPAHIHPTPLQELWLSSFHLARGFFFSSHEPFSFLGVSF